MNVELYKQLSSKTDPYLNELFCVEALGWFYKQGKLWSDAHRGWTDLELSRWNGNVPKDYCGKLAEIFPYFEQFECPEKKIYQFTDFRGKIIWAVTLSAVSSVADICLSRAIVIAIILQLRANKENEKI